MKTYKIAFITPTMDRLADLRKMLDSLQKQTRLIDQIIIVDASKVPVNCVVNEFANLPISYLQWQEKPSAATQRNGGISLLKADIDLVCFFDDDQVLHDNAVELMENFYQKNDIPKLGGTAFYSTDYDLDKRSMLFKNSWICRKLGFYAPMGKVAKSGWQSVIKKTEDNIELEWMSSSAMMLKREILTEFKFDDFFTGYSYLEDLDFSYSISKKYKLQLVANAKFDHFHSTSGRSSRYNFGIMEIQNRRYFVKKHKLSMSAYHLAMFIRFCISIAHCEFSRAFGNIVAIFKK